MGFSDVVMALRLAQERLQREINPTVDSLAEFRKKLQTGHHFLTSVMGTSKIFLVGGERELTRLGT